jgi:hypothetical protein
MMVLGIGLGVAVMVCVVLGLAMWFSINPKTGDLVTVGLDGDEDYAAEAPMESAGPGVALPRYPTVECQDEVSDGQEFTVQVSLTEDAATPQVAVLKGADPEDKSRVRLPLPERRDVPDKDAWEVGVVILANDFRLLDASDHAVLTLPREGDSDVVSFRLKARRARPDGQPSKLFVTFWHGGTFLAKVARGVTVLGDAAPPEGVQQGDGAFTTIPRPVEFDYEYAPKPDLTLYVLNNLGGAREGRIIIDSPYLQLSSTPFPASVGLDGWLAAQYKAFAGMRPRDPTAEGSVGPPASVGRERMRGFGLELYKKYAPPAFKQAFWKLLKERRGEFRTIQIYTDNPTIPWELMKPVSDDGVERDFLGLEFSVGRWHVSEIMTAAQRPPNVLLLREFVTVAPEYVGAQALPALSRELRSLASFPNYRRMPGNMAALKQLFANMPDGIIHFAGHGSAGPPGEGAVYSAIELEDGKLDPVTWRGMVGGHGTTHPLFFFNACEVGRAERTANFVNGWAPAVLESGASGYIGALWPLGDSGAAEFAHIFYNSLGRGALGRRISVSDVLRLTRREYLKNGDPTFLAYVYYGDPNLRLEVR